MEVVAVFLAHAEIVGLACPLLEKRHREPEAAT
jgi:hypothetical protein